VLERTCAVQQRVERAAVERVRSGTEICGDLVACIGQRDRCGLSVACRVEVTLVGEGCVSALDRQPRLCQRPTLAEQPLGSEPDIGELAQQ
jgi:hypothetical protein